MRASGRTPTPTAIGPTARARCRLRPGCISNRGFIPASTRGGRSWPPFAVAGIHLIAGVVAELPRAWEMRRERHPPPAWAEKPDPVGYSELREPRAFQVSG